MLHLDLMLLVAINMSVVILAGHLTILGRTGRVYLLFIQATPCVHPVSIRQSPKYIQNSAAGLLYIDSMLGKEQFKEIIKSPKLP